MAKLLVVDNYDSFTYNLVQMLGSLGFSPIVWRNDCYTLSRLQQLKPAGVIISPGPGHPGQAGMSLQTVDFCKMNNIPLLGVCLGHQALGAYWGANIILAPRLMHGKVSMVHHEGEEPLQEISSPFKATRYHSLAVERENLPSCLKVIAWTDEGDIMAIKHRLLPQVGLQFHPESVMTQEGKKIMRNFCRHCGLLPVPEKVAESRSGGRFC